MDVCASCGRSATEVFQLRSVLDYEVRGLCEHCLDHQAEPEAVVKGKSDNLRDLTAEILRAVHVCQGGMYLTLAQWQATNAAPGPHYQNAEDRASEDQLLMQRMMAIRPTLDQPVFNPADHGSVRRRITELLSANWTTGAQE